MSLRKPRNSEPSSRPHQQLVPSITVTQPAEKHATLRLVFETVTVVVLFLSLLLSFFQFLAAERKERDAVNALSLANQAKTATLDARNILAEHQAALAELRRQEKLNQQLAEVGYLTVRAENGDRSALAKLFEMARAETNKPLLEFSASDKNIQRILALYKGDSIADPWVALETNSPPAMDPNLAIGSLSSPTHQGRAFGIMSVCALRINSQIPHLIEMGTTEPDLHVLQVLCSALPKMLRPAGYDGNLDVYDFVITPEKTARELDDFWQSHSNALLAVKPKYWKVTPNPPYAPMWVLTDPDSEQPTAGGLGDEADTLKDRPQHGPVQGNDSD